MSVSLAIALVLLGQQPVPKGFARPAPPPAVFAKPPLAPPTVATPIVLDFRSQTVAQVAFTLNQRTGGMVEVQGVNDALGNGMNPAMGGDRRITLDSPAPVPFWEAMDRFMVAIQLQRQITWADPFGNPRPRLQFHFPISPDHDYGPSAYVGPFRFGPVVIHERFERVFLKPKPQIAVETAPSFYVDIPTTPELNLLSTMIGPLRKLEAVDELGQSLLDPKLGGESAAPGLYLNLNQNPKTFRVPLVRPAKSSMKLATLRGLVPLEVGRRPNEPTSIVPLEGSAGKTFRDGDIAITVREYRLDDQWRTHLKFSVKIEGKRGEPDSKLKGLLWARVDSTVTQQLEVVNSLRKNVSMNGGSGLSPDGVMNLDYLYQSDVPGTKGAPPTHLRIYRAEWVNWDLPFEFKDLTLP